MIQNFLKYPQIYYILSLIMVVLLGKEYIIINEEFIIIVAFLIIFFSLKKVLGKVVEEEFDHRNKKNAEVLVKNYEMLLAVNQSRRCNRSNIYFKVHETYQFFSLLTNEMEILIDNSKLLKKVEFRSNTFNYVLGQIIKHKIKQIKAIRLPVLK